MAAQRYRVYRTFLRSIRLRTGTTNKPIPSGPLHRTMSDLKKSHIIIESLLYLPFVVYDALRSVMTGTTAGFRKGRSNAVSWCHRFNSVQRLRIACDDSFRFCSQKQMTKRQRRQLRPSVERLNQEHSQNHKAAPSSNFLPSSTEHCRRTDTYDCFR